MGEEGLAPHSASQIELTSILALGNADARWRQAPLETSMVGDEHRWRRASLETSIVGDEHRWRRASALPSSKIEVSLMFNAFRHVPKYFNLRVVIAFGVGGQNQFERFRFGHGIRDRVPGPLIGM